MIRIKNIRLGLAGALIVPVALALVACSPIYADDPNEVKEGIFSPEVELEALNEKIQSAVESGAISQDQVDAVIEIFKSGISESRNPHHKKPFVAPDEIKAKIAAAVESGELTQEEADKKLATLEERIEKGQRWHGKGKPHHKKPFMGIEEINAKISAAVENGEITQEEADEKLADIEAKRNQRQEKIEVKIDEIKAKIAAAVESGELTQEEADKKVATLEERIEKGQRWHGKGNPHHKKPFVAPDEIKAKIAAAVESGELTQEEADKKLATLEERIEKGQRWHGKGKPHHKKPFMDIEEIKAKIAAAVENGELSAEEAKNKLLYIDGKLKKATYY